MQSVQNIFPVIQYGEAHPVRQCKTASLMPKRGQRCRRKSIANHFEVREAGKIIRSAAECEVHRRSVRQLNNRIGADTAERRSKPRRKCPRSSKQQIRVDELELHLYTVLQFKTLVDQPSDNFKLIAAGIQPHFQFFAAARSACRYVIIVKE